MKRIGFILAALLALSLNAPGQGFTPGSPLVTLGTPPNQGNVAAVIDALRNPDPRIEDAAWTALWAIPRAWTPEQIDAILQWLPSAPPALQPKVAERIPAILGTLVLPRKDLDQAAFLPAEIPLVRSLYATTSRPLLQSLLNSDRLLKEVPIPPSLFPQWLALPDDVSLAALRIAPERLDAKTLAFLLEGQWSRADPAWRMQSVQLDCGAEEYLAWLRQHASGGDEIAKRAQMTLQLHSPDPAERRATLEIAGKSDDPAVMRILLTAMSDPDESVASAALSTFWEAPRPYTDDVMEEMLQLIPTVSPPMKRNLVENLPIIVSQIAQQRSLWGLPPLSPQNARVIQLLFSSDDPRILRNMLADYFYFNGLFMPADRVLRWIAMPDEVSIKALALAPFWIPPATLLSALDERWKVAGTAWKLQAVQMAWGYPEYLKWLDRHSETGEVAEMADLTIRMLTGLTPEKMAQARRKLKAPAPLHRWAQMLQGLGKAGSDLALAEMKPGAVLVPDFIQTWGAYATPLPQDIACALQSDPRMVVRSFSALYIRTVTPDQAKGWCASDHYDVRILGAKFADRAAVEDLLVDERPEVRLAAIVRWAGENWPDLDKILNYGLSDPLLTDNLLLAAIRLPQCQATLAAWGASEPQRSKLNSAKSIPYTPLPLPLPAR